MDLAIKDLITVTPLGTRVFEVIALDDVYNEFVYAAPVDGLGAAQWHSLTYVRVVRPVSDGRYLEMINDGMGFIPREAAIIDHPSVARLHREMGLAPQV